jgi:hypothetical protein
MISLEDVRGMDLRRRFPGVVTFGVSFPFDEVLEGSRSSMTSVANDALDFKLLFSINQIRRWTREVWSVGGRFLIGGKK